MCRYLTVCAEGKQATGLGFGRAIPNRAKPSEQLKLWKE
jgi:hypothetical protein